MSKTAPVIDKLKATRTEMKESLVERGAEIDLVILTALARTHMVMLGDPGVGKSMLIRSFLSHVTDATLFEILLNKTTPPEALVGPISLKALENDEFRRVTTDKLPEANIGFIDEIYKSNATNLNLLLPIVNERIFHNNGSPIAVPLWSIFAASNELPTHDRTELMAFTDRMPIRKVVAPVRTTDGLTSILEGQITRDRGEVVASAHTTISKDEFEAVQAAVHAVAVPTRVLTAIAELQLKAADEGMAVSSRRMGEGRRLAQANALLNDRNEVKIEDLRIFEHILWDDPEDIPLASDLTLDFAGDVGKNAAKLRGEYEQFAAKLTEAQGMFPADPTENVSDQAAGAMATCSRNFTQLDQRVSRAIEEAESDGYDAAELESIREDVKRARSTVRAALTGSLLPDED